MSSSCVFAVAERHPANPAVAAWGDTGRVVTCGLDDPVALAEWLVREGAGRDVDHVVLLCRRAERRAAHLAATIAAGRMPSLTVSVVSHRVTGLAIALAAQLVAGRGLANGEAIETVLEVASQVRNGVFLRSVANLDRPRPSMAQHVRSILPLRPGFVAWAGEPGSVTSLSRKQPVVDAGGRRVVVERPASEPVGAPTFEDATGVVPVVPVVDVHAHYGAHGWEFSLLPVTLTSAERTGRCPVCASRLVAESCPACHVRATPDGPAPSTATHAAPGDLPTTQKDAHA